MFSVQLTYIPDCIRFSTSATYTLPVFAAERNKAHFCNNVRMQMTTTYNYHYDL